MLCCVSLVVQCLKLCPSNTGGTGSILGWEFSHTVRPKTKQNKVSVVLFFIRTFNLHASLYWEWVSSKQQRAGLVFGPLWQSILIGAFIYLFIKISLWTIFKVFIESATILLLLCVSVFWPWGLWAPSSPTPCTGRRISTTGRPRKSLFPPCLAQSRFLLLYLWWKIA